MKLVDIDEVSQTDSPHLLPPSDDNFSASRKLSILDNFMSDILNRRDIGDGEKWMLYNQSLQRFLNYMKQARTSNLNTNHTIETKFNESKLNTEDQQNSTFDNTFDPFDEHISDHDISGVFPIRDSIDSITQPVVKRFFEQARQNDPLSSPPAAATSADNSLMSFIEESSPQPQLHPHVTKRAPKRNASQNLSGLPPNKMIAPRSLYRPRKQAKPNHALYWEATNAK